MQTSDILVVLAGAALVVYGVFGILRRYVFLQTRCTARVPGAILGMERTETEHGDDDRVTRTYYIKYHYFVDGVEYSKKRSLSKRQHRALGKDDEFTVVYDPSGPKRHYVLEIKFRLLLMLGLMALGALLLYFPYYDGLL